MSADEEWRAASRGHVHTAPAGYPGGADRLQDNLSTARRSVLPLPGGIDRTGRHDAAAAYPVQAHTTAHPEPPGTPVPPMEPVSRRVLADPYTGPDRRETPRFPPPAFDPE